MAEEELAAGRDRPGLMAAARTRAREVSAVGAAGETMGEVAGMAARGVWARAGTAEAE